jgi:hypothetical protein
VAKVELVCRHIKISPVKLVHVMSKGVLVAAAVPPGGGARYLE